MRHAKLRVTLLVVAPALAALVAACDDDDDAEAALAGTSWVLVSFAGDDVLSGTDVTAEFAEDQVSGSAGCNSYSGSYEADNDSDLDVPGPFAVTLRACETGVMDQESAFLSALEDAESYSVDGDELIIETGEGDLRFERAGS